MAMLLRAFAIWLMIMVLAILNGAVRTAVVAPRLGDRAGQVIGTALLCGLIFGVAWLAVAWIRPANSRDAALVGLSWLALTLAFEFLAGHYLFGDSWDKLLADYDVLRGRVWPLVPLTTLVAPLAAYWLRLRDLASGMRD